jgi:hypothetical protein
MRNDAVASQLEPAKPPWLPLSFMDGGMRRNFKSKYADNMMQARSSGFPSPQSLHKISESLNCMQKSVACFALLAHVDCGTN